MISQTATPAIRTTKPSKSIRGKRAPLELRVEPFTFIPVHARP